MVAMETTTVMKILISIFGEYFQVAWRCKVWLWSDKGRKCYQELKFSNFLFLTALKSIKCYTMSDEGHAEQGFRFLSAGVEKNCSQWRIWYSLGFQMANSIYAQRMFWAAQRQETPSGGLGACSPRKRWNSNAWYLLKIHLSHLKVFKMQLKHHRFFLLQV